MLSNVKIWWILALMAIGWVLELAKGLALWRGAF